MLMLTAFMRPACAQDADRLETRSYHMNVAFTNGETFDVIIELSPRTAYHFTRNNRAPGSEAYSIDGMMYVRTRYHGWMKFPVAKPSVQSAYFMEHFAQIVGILGNPSALAGRTIVEDGVTYGLVQPPQPIPLVVGGKMAGTISQCSYDLTTFRPHACTTSIAVVHYGAYNDPADIITLPPAAHTARLIRTPSAN
jgi:hypothetical protein